MLNLHVGENGEAKKVESYTHYQMDLLWKQARSLNLNMYITETVPFFVAYKLFVIKLDITTSITINCKFIQF